jgi:hypothetical protein
MIAVIRPTTTTAPRSFPQPMGPGIHQAEIVSVRDLGERRGKYGTSRVVAVTFEVKYQTAAENGRQAVRFYNPTVHEKSRLSADLSVFYGHVPEDFEDTEELVGLYCKIRVEHRTRPDGQIRAEVVEILERIG